MPFEYAHGPDGGFDPFGQDHLRRAVNSGSYLVAHATVFAREFQPIRVGAVTSVKDSG